MLGAPRGARIFENECLERSAITFFDGLVFVTSSIGALIIGTAFAELTLLEEESNTERAIFIASLLSLISTTGYIPKHNYFFVLMQVCKMGFFYGHKK